MEVKWGQWQWTDTGPGRWHALAGAALGLTPDGLIPVVQTACGRIRPLPSETATEPGEPVCEQCQQFAALREAAAKAEADGEQVFVPVAVSESIH